MAPPQGSHRWWWVVLELPAAEQGQGDVLGGAVAWG